MYLTSALNGTSGLGACAVPAAVTLRRLVCTNADRTAIGTALGLTDASGNPRAATAAEVRTRITNAIQRAVTLINNAAAPLRRPRAAGAAGETMRIRFRDAFGTMPEFVPSWRPAGQTWDRGAVVRERLRCAAKIMSEGDIEFFCWAAGSCPFTPAGGWTANIWAGVVPGQYRLCLAPRFWRASREGHVEAMATTLLHECLHIYFDTIRHALERGPYNTATCYERYVLVANGLPLHDAVSIPCPSKAPVGDFPVPARGGAQVAGLGSLGWFGQPTTCKPEPGEVAASRTNAGILTNDVEFTDKGVLITDFGVDRGSVKPSTKAQLASVLADLEKDNVKTIKITGFDDCFKTSPREHIILRKRRALKVKELLGPKARSKVTFAGAAPLTANQGPNTDRAARARNRSVLIEWVKGVDFSDEPVPITGKPCHEQLIRRALRVMRDDQSMDSKLKTRLGAALGNSLAGNDDSFIRPGGTLMIPFRWSSIKEYFTLICNNQGGTLPKAELMRWLDWLDQDIKNGVAALVREEQNSTDANKNLLLSSKFRHRLDALLKNKSKSVYAEY